MKTWLKIISKCTILLIITVVIWLGLTPFFRTDIDNSGNLFRALPKNSMDIIILGSSHAQYSMNPAIINKESGYYSTVLGSGCQPMSMSYKFLEESLKTQSPEVVILDVFTMMPTQDVCYADGMFYKAIQQMSGKTRYEAAALVDNKEVKYDYMFDLRMYHSNWKNDDFYGAPKNNAESQYSFGYVLQMPEDFRYIHLIPFEKKSEYTLKEKDVKMLDSIIKLCKEKNITLILMKAPIIIDQENQDALETIWEYADSQGIEHVDFLELAEEIGFTIGMDGDTWHNNIWGAEKLSKYMADYIVSNDYIKKHQDNEELNDAYKREQAQTMAYMSMNQVDIYKQLEWASQYDCMVAVKYTGSKGYSSITEGENELLQNIGLSKDFITNQKENYYALVHNGNIVCESDEPIQEEYQGLRYEIAEDKISLGDQIFDELGELELIFFGEDGSWYHEMPIDYASSYFWKKGCDSWECE